MSGDRRGVGATLLRIGLTPASWVYGAAVTWRNRGYEANPNRTQRVNAAVVSIGNITTGGTGKTPMVEWIARWFRKRNLRVAVVSRGYGAEYGAQNDEAMELEQRLPDVPHLQNPDRVAAAKIAIDELESQLILLDDAMQHRRIHRDLNIVLVDALSPFGFDHLLPRGLLREPLAGLRRADLVILTRADQVDAQHREQIKAVVRNYAPDVAWAECVHKPKTLLAHSGDREDCRNLHGAEFGAFCGIGNPAGFAASLATLAGNAPAMMTFPDHHAYERDDIERLCEWADSNGFKKLVCTHKDLVKVGVDRIGSAKLYALVIEVEFTAGEAHITKQLEEIARGIPTEEG